MEGADVLRLCLKLRSKWCLRRAPSGFTQRYAVNIDRMQRWQDLGILKAMMNGETSWALLDALVTVATERKLHQWNLTDTDRGDTTTIEVDVDRI